MKEKKKPKKYKIAPIENIIGEKSKEKCPKCGSKVLMNKQGDKWCWRDGCHWSNNQGLKKLMKELDV